MSNRKSAGAKTTTKSFKVPVEHDELVETYFSNAAAQLGITKGEALVHVVLIMKEHGNLPAIIAGGFMNMQRALERIEANTELAAYGNDLGAIEEARQKEIGSKPEDDIGSAYDAFMEAGVEIVGGDDLDTVSAEDLNAFDQQLRIRRPKFGNEVRLKRKS